MQMNLIIGGFFIVLLLLIFNLFNSVFDLFKSLKESSHNNDRLKRINQLQEGAKKTNKETIDEYTKPFINKYFTRLSRVLPSFQHSNIVEIDKNLKLTGWDDTFTPQSFLATNIILKFVGVIFLIFVIVMKGPMKIIPVAWFGVLFFVLDSMFKQAINEKKDDLFNGFPEFIRITTSFLSANMPFVDSVEKASKYVNDAWKPILSRFVQESDSLGVQEALGNLRDRVDLFEVKEFVGLVRLTLEQGGRAKEGFEEQAEKISEMKKSRLMKIIATRKIYVTILDFPLLLASMTVIALPTLANISVFMNL